MTAAVSESVTEPVRYANSIDAYAFGEHRSQGSRVGSQFTGRLTADGSSGYLAEPGRYHLYAGKADPRSHRAALAIALAGLNNVVSISFVDGIRDGRGWASGKAPAPIR